MEAELQEYLKTQRTCVLAVEMPDGSPHAATVHFAHQDKPLTFIFETNRAYRKSEALLARPLSRASLVIGCNEGDMRTLQLDGEVGLSNDPELRELYLQKFPEKRAKADQSSVLFFSFTPTWWRFTDYARPEGKTLYYSTGETQVFRNPY